MATSAPHHNLTKTISVWVASEFSNSRLLKNLCSGVFVVFRDELYGKVATLRNFSSWVIAFPGESCGNMRNWSVWFLF